MVEDRIEEDRVQPALQLSQPTSSLDWLEPVYREHSSTVFKTAYRVTGNAADAEDVLQTVFFKLARRKEAPDLSRGAAPYLRRAATNAALDMVKSRKIRSAPPLEVVADQAVANSAEGPERLHLAQEIRTQLRRAVASLNRRSAEIFVMRYFENLDNRQIAEVLSTSPGTVAVTLHRTRSQLLKKMRPYLGGEK